ncbi:hypothetical protein [Tumebacillus permanentifrigoris]|uniref:Uncharacterized protein n=1 Tax=Tumebacillus permanentifrigoris TaxID=378543 RepID=A0A316DDE5_9BACL|nr:hypothetical protein [Tumebacillus permanentifrigoris]PWK15995.1 hypothetical protein C7459_102241 [Tumebacillus permanentifrigoris]
MEKTKIAILITHGAGDQGELDTLDVCARNLVQSLQVARGRDLKLTHRRLQGANGGQDYVQLTDNKRSNWEVDVHEYYWASRVERQITLKETLGWMGKASDGAGIHGVGPVLRGMSQLGALGEKLMPKWLDPLYRSLMGMTAQMLVDYLGDVAVYTSGDLRSKWHEVREDVLSGALEKLLMLINEDYDRIILVGHSLGSVVLYDALNRLNLNMNDDAVLAAKRHKLFELITLGSPLDMTALYLAEHIGEHEYVKRLIVDHVNGFRRRWPEVSAPQGTVLTSYVTDCLAHLRWTNYWDVLDPIGGPLNEYLGVKNVKVDNNRAFGFAHLGYFENVEIYREALERATPRETVKVAEADRHLRAI